MKHPTVLTTVVRRGLPAAILALGLTTTAGGQEATSSMLSPATRVAANGQPIDLEQGGAAPFFGDFDGDGLPDLLVGQGDGKLRIYRNRGTNERRRFDEFEWFKAGASGDAGQVLPSPPGMVGGQAGFVPQLVDFDGDGLTDVLSCTGNGAIVLFRRLKGGSFAEGESLKRPDGLEMIGAPGAGVYAADWDGDGDLDLAVASGREGMSLLRNIGDRRQPTYGQPELFQEDGDPVNSRHGGLAPVMADWDGDGLVDLIVGAGDGSVMFYRHTGAATSLTAEEGKALVPPFFHGDDDQQTPKPGRGARPCVCDFNSDGRLDLLVGDVWYSVVTPEIKLTAAEREHDMELKEKLASLSKRFSAGRQALESDSGPAREKRIEDLRVISNMMRAMRRELNRPPPDSVFTSHGQVWAYLREKENGDK